MAEQVKVLGWWVSPFCRRVELALKLKGVGYEYLEQDLANKSQLLLQYNPVHKKVPVLVHNGKIMAESLVILEYIDETWPNKYPIFPKDPYDRAMARFWAKFVDEQCFGGFWKIIFEHDEEERERLMEEALHHFGTLEAQLMIKDGGKKKFFGGDEIGAVDIAAIFIGYELGVAQEAKGLELVTEEKFPVLWKWMEEFAGHSVVKETLPPRDELLVELQARVHASSWKY